MATEPKKWSLRFAIALMAVLALPAVAYAGSKVTFSAVTDVLVVGPLQALDPGTATPMDTTAEFKERKRDETIKKVTVYTTNEYVTSTGAGIQLLSCEPAGAAFCSAIQGAALSSLHDSTAKLTNIQQIPGAALAGLDPSFALFPDVLVGDLSGELEGMVTIVGATPTDTLQGEIKLRIRRNTGSPPGLPTAVYGCIASLIPFNPSPLPIRDCQDGAGELVPLFLNITDTGKVKLTTSSGAFGDVDKARTKLEVTVVGSNGVGVITNGRAKVSDSDEDEDDE